MVEPIWIILALATASPIALGIFPILGKGLPERTLHAALGVTAGLLLGIAFLDLIPEALHVGGEGVPLTLGLSFLALYLVEWVMGVHGHGAHEHGEHESGDHFHRARRFPLMAIAALALHTFVDGLVLPSAFEAGAAVGITAGLGVAAHQAPDGFAAGTILAARGASKGQILAGVLLVAVLTPIGALIGMPLASEPTYLGHLLAIAAGTFIFIAAAELLPELHHGPHKGLVTVASFVGFGLVVLMGMLAGTGHAH